jgi:hypothetical protein
MPFPAALVRFRTDKPAWSLEQTAGRLLQARMMRWSSHSHFERDYLYDRYAPRGWFVVLAIAIFLFLWIALAISFYREMPP